MGQQILAFAKAWLKSTTQILKPSKCIPKPYQATMIS